MFRFARGAELSPSRLHADPSIGHLRWHCGSLSRSPYFTAATRHRRTLNPLALDAMTADPEAGRILEKLLVPAGRPARCSMC
jgi:hypothetical protein